MADYYDWVLAGILGSVLAGVAASAVMGLGLRAGLFAGALVATLFLYDAMFRNPPLPRTDLTMVVPVIAWHLGVGLLGVGLVG
jgi:uncharacterized protein YneF (UPF0154 family)